MAEKVEKLGVNRDKDFMYYVKDAAVWRVQRKQPGVPKGRPEKVADGTFKMDTDFIYFVDKDGDVSRAKRAVGGQKRKKAGGRAKSSAGRGSAKGKAKSKAGTSARGAGKSSKAGKGGKAGGTKAKSAAGKKGSTKAKAGRGSKGGAKKSTKGSSQKPGKKKRR